MSKPYFHAQSSAKKYGGIWEDYMPIHEMMDSSKAAFPDNRHRALTHNSWFISFILPKIFGETFCRKSDGKIVNTRDIGEQHVLEDYKFKFIPTVSDFLSEMDFISWMQNGEGPPPESHKKITKSIVEPVVKPTAKVPTGPKKTLLEKLKVRKEEIKIISPRPRRKIRNGGSIHGSHDMHRTFD